MTTITCGWCKARCHMTPSGATQISKLPYGGYVADAAFTCDGCNRMSVATWITQHLPHELRSPDRHEGPAEYEEAQWSPQPGHQVDFPDVPDKIAEAAREAWTCHVGGAYRGAVMLARTVVESTAKEKGITKGTLESKINELAEQGLIRNAVAHQAHEIRYTGNSTAHGDLNESVTPEESEEVLNLMAEVLNEVWQAPKKASRLAAARRARKSQPQSEEPKNY